jgi:hypothetical protein
MPHFTNPEIPDDGNNYFIKIQPELKYRIIALIVNLIPVCMLLVMLLNIYPGNLLELLLYIFTIGYAVYYSYLLWKSHAHNEVGLLDTPTVIISILIVVYVSNGSGILSIPGSVIAFIYLLKWYLFPAKNRQPGFQIRDSEILYRPSDYSRILRIPMKNLVKISDSENIIRFSYSDGKEILINLKENRYLTEIASKLKQFVTLNL